MAEKETQKAKPKPKPKVQPEQYLNTNDWPLYRALTLYRVKEDPEGKKNIIVSQDGKAKYISTEELLAEFEPVKGLHKRQF